MSNARSERRRQARAEAKKHQKSQPKNWAFTPPAGSINVDAWVDDNEAHIKELNDEPIMKWFAKLANFLDDVRECPPHVLLPTLHRFYHLDLHAAVRACQMGIPWGTLVLAEKVDSCWGTHEAMKRPAATELVSALRSSVPNLNATTMLLAMSRTAYDLKTTVHALRWAGQFSGGEIKSAIEKMREPSFWMFFPKNKKWLKESKDADSLLENAGIIVEDGTKTPASVSTEEIRRLLRSAGDLHEITVSKWRHLSKMDSEGKTSDIVEITEALASALDTSTRFTDILRKVESCPEWISPLTTTVPNPPGSRVMWAVPAESSLPTPPFDPSLVPVAQDMPFWYAKAADAHSYVATFFHANDEPNRAVQFAREALRTAEKSGLARARVQQSNNLAHALIIHGSVDSLNEAEPLMKLVVNYYKTSGNRLKLQNALVNQSRIALVRSGKPDVYSKFRRKSLDIPEFNHGLLYVDDE
jgi:hypothetical protein